MIILFLFLPIIGMFSFIGYLFWINRCPKGGQHDYEIVNSRYISGNDIGFGITNSCVEETHKCKKCGDKYTSI